MWHKDCTGKNQKSQGKASNNCASHNKKFKKKPYMKEV